MNKEGLCAVVGCENQWMPQKGTATYYSFPRVGHASRPLWIEYVRRNRMDSTWSPSPGIYICSDHFKETDKYMTAKGVFLTASAVPCDDLRELGESLPRTESVSDPGSVNSITTEPILCLYYEDKKDEVMAPENSTLNPANSTQEENKIDSMVCRVCLTTSRRVYSLQALGLASTYSALAGARCGELAAPPRAACAACATQLRAARRLADRSRRANDLLAGLLERSVAITMEDVNQLHRGDPALTPTSLVTVRFVPDHCDFYFNEETIIANDSGCNDEDRIYVPNSADCKDDEIKKENLGVFREEEIWFPDNLELLNDEHVELPANTGVTNEGEAESSVDLDFLKQEGMQSQGNSGLAEREAEKEANVTEEQDDFYWEVPTDDAKETPKAAAPQTAPNSAENKLAQTDAVVTKTAQEIFDTYFTIKRLSPQKQIEQFEKRKLTDNYKHSPFKCDFCYRGFVAQEAHRMHMAKHSESRGSMECPVCHIRMRTRLALRRHTLDHDRIYSCKLCPFVTQTSSTAGLHGRWHGGVVYPCELCVGEKVVFNRKTSLLSHLRLFHPARDSRSCPLCGYGFLGKLGVSHHISRKHSGEAIPTEGPRCEECDCIFVSEEVRLKHQKVVHERCLRNDSSGHPRTTKSGTRKKGCDLVRNIRPSAANETHICTACGEQYPSRGEYRQHMRHAHGRATNGLHNQVLRVQCHVCGKLFTSPASLADHMGTHDAAGAHTCSVCGKAFRTRVSMQIHRRSHTERFQCPVCKKEFNNQGNRNRHYTYVHSDVKDVKCTVCGKAFKSEGERKLHEKHVHILNAWPKRVRKRRERARVES